VNQSVWVDFLLVNWVGRVYWWTVVLVVVLVEERLRTVVLAVVVEVELHCSRAVVVEIFCRSTAVLAVVAEVVRELYCSRVIVQSCFQVCFHLGTVVVLDLLLVDRQTMNKK
jgi:hypothetical protein